MNEERECTMDCAPSRLPRPSAVSSSANQLLLHPLLLLLHPLLHLPPRTSPLLLLHPLLLLLHPLWFAENLADSRAALIDARSPAFIFFILFFFHGGGFILFSSATAPMHACCARLASELPALVLSVDYRLAPEHRLPAAFEDAIDALLWLRAHATGASTEGNLPLPLTDCADFSRCFLMGTSAGASIAFHAAVLEAALPEPLDPVNIAGLVLDQPYFGGIERTESELRLKDDKIIPLPTNDLMWELALPEGADRDHEYSNPLKNEEKLFAGLRNFPRCLVRGHTGDPLFDRQREFVRMLERRGVSVAASLESDGFHAVELFDPIKEEEFVAEVKRFVCGKDGVATASAAVITLQKL